MTIQLEISNPQDAELILNLVRRLNIPFKQKSISKTSNSEEKGGEQLRIEADTPRMDMASAAALLAKDYAHDDELTVFSVLDSEDFYEQR